MYKPLGGLTASVRGAGQVARTGLPVYVNGALVPEDEARVSVFDRGFARGDGLFETLRAYGGRAFMLDEHLARLNHGLSTLRYQVSTADLGLRAAVEETVSASGLASARVRVQITRGIGTTEFDTRTETSPTVIVAVQPLADRPPKPLSTVISRIRRDELSPIAGIKTTNYIPSILARMEAEDAGADDAILLNYAGFVAEGCASNLFIVHSGRLLTPDLASGVLPGIVRQTVLQIAAELGIPTIEKPIEPALLEAADEIFLTSSTREVVPVATLEGRRVGEGTFEMAEMLGREYRARTGE